MSDTLNRWNPTRFWTARGIFYGMVYYHRNREVNIRSSSVADREIGDRIVLQGKVYEVIEVGKTRHYNHKVRLALIP